MQTCSGSRNGLSIIPINERSWECYTAAHGEGLEKSSGAEIFVNARKWESNFPPTQ
jgi:hypothetical protein